MFVFKPVFFTAVVVTIIYCLDQNATDIETYRNYGGCLDLQDAIDVFYSEPCRSMPKVEYLMRLFDYHCPNISTHFRMMAQLRQHVFIALEGTHRETKMILTKMLARKLRGKFKFSPPYFLVRTGYKFTDTRTMSRAYYCLCYYAAAYSMAMTLRDMPVVTGGYWMDQLAFGMVASFNEQIPEPTSPLYTWPGDLLAPDVIFFLNLPSHNRKIMFTENDTLTFRSRLIQFYRNWGGPPPVVEINNTNVYRDVIHIMMNYVERRLKYWKHLQPQPHFHPVGRDMNYD